MKAIESIKNKKQVLVIAGVAIAAILLVFATGMAVFYSGQAEAGDIGSDKAVGSVIQSAADGFEAPTLEQAETEEEKEAGSDEADEAGQPIAEAAQAASSETGAIEQRNSAPSTQGESAPSAQPVQSAGGTSGSKSGQATSSAPAPQKKWVEETERVWVEDKAAWTESVPVYGTKEVSICNVCGADITGNTAAHSKAHMMAGEGSGHHSEVQKVVTGYNSVSHPAEGHWETKVVGGHWE